MSQGEETKHNPEQIAPEWVAITPQRAEVRWTGPTRQASEAHLALLASDVFAVQAGQPPRFFDKGGDGVWRRKAEPAKEIPRQLPGGPDLWDAPSSVCKEAEHHANALAASGNADAAKELRAMIANGADDDALSVFMALSAGLPDAREEAEPAEPAQDNDPRNMRIGDPWMLGARGVFEVVRLLRKEYGDGPANLFTKTFYRWAYKP